MKPIWLIETGDATDANVGRMIEILRNLGFTVHAEPFTYLGGTEFEIVDPNQPVIFYGSLGTAEYLRVFHRNWIPLVWMDNTTFNCRSYYARWGQFLLQEHYGFYPLAELPRLKDNLYRAFGKEEMVFIRPDTNDKLFTGRLVPQDTFNQWYEQVLFGKPDLLAFAVVASPVHVEAEWRFVIADRKVIAGSAYRGGAKLNPFSDYERGATQFADEIAVASWQPRPIYCADVAYSGDRYRLVEIGGINCAGLYRCELLPVIQAMNAIAEREFRHWRGRSS